MKKLLLLVTLLAVTASMWAQGNVSFRNTASTSFYLYTNGVGDPSTRFISGDNAYRIGLYASPGTGATSNSLMLVGLATNANILVGRFIGPDPLVLPAGYAAGSPITFQIRAWSFAGGLSYEEAWLNASINFPHVLGGASVIGTVIPSADSAEALFGTGPGLVQGFELRPIPEPSSIALGLLGLGAMALFRRKK